jgi:hypothetical protein
MSRGVIELPAWLHDEGAVKISPNATMMVLKNCSRWVLEENEKKRLTRP